MNMSKNHSLTCDKFDLSYEKGYPISTTTRVISPHIPTLGYGATIQILLIPTARPRNDESANMGGIQAQGNTIHSRRLFSDFLRAQS